MGVKILQSLFWNCTSHKLWDRLNWDRWNKTVNCEHVVVTKKRISNICEKLKMKCFDGIANFYNTHKFPITLEPVVFFWSFPAGMNQVYFWRKNKIWFSSSGSFGLKPCPINNDSLFKIQVVRTSLVVEKICRNKLNYTEVICGNLSAYEDIQDDVQRSVTAYEADMQMLAFVPRWLFLMLVLINKYIYLSPEFCMQYLLELGQTGIYWLFFYFISISLWLVSCHQYRTTINKKNIHEQKWTETLAVFACVLPTPSMFVFYSQLCFHGWVRLEIYVPWVGHGTRYEWSIQKWSINKEVLKSPWFWVKLTWCSLWSRW